MTRVEPVALKVGQVWADNDSRYTGRTLRVDGFDGAEARVLCTVLPSTEAWVLCTVLTNTDDVQAALDNPQARLWYRPQDRRGKTTRVAATRFRPTSTGYRLVKDTL